MLAFLTNQTGGLVAVALVVVLVALRALTRDPIHRQELRSAALLFVGYLAARLGIGLLSPFGYVDAARYCEAAAYVLFTFGSVRTATSVGVWLFRTRRGVATPKILRDVVDGVLYVTAVAAVLRATFQVDLGGLLTTSAILSVVVGLALQETLGSLFSGLALQLDPPFSVGDWVGVGPHTEIGRAHV